MLPHFPSTRTLPVLAVSSGSLCIAGRQEAASLGDVEEGSSAATAEAPAATWCCTQHDTRHTVSTNTLSCHYAPHVPESSSLCLFIHYLLCSSNKVGPVRDTLRG